MIVGLIELVLLALIADDNFEVDVDSIEPIPRVLVVGLIEPIPRVLDSLIEPIPRVLDDLIEPVTLTDGSFFVVDEVSVLDLIRVAVGVGRDVSDVVEEQANWSAFLKAIPLNSLIPHWHCAFT